MEEDILNLSPTVMFLRTPCTKASQTIRIFFIHNSRVFLKHYFPYHFNQNNEKYIYIFFDILNFNEKMFDGNLEYFENAIFRIQSGQVLSCEMWEHETNEGEGEKVDINRTINVQFFLQDLCMSDTEPCILEIIIFILV